MDYVRVSNWRVIVVALVMAAGWFAGCDRGSTVDSVAVAQEPENAQEAGALEAAGVQAEAKEEVPREQYYSPFVISVQGDVVFKEVTFTDVGISQPDPGPVDETLLETIAESLALKLSASKKLNYKSKVHHDAAMADPSNHLFCEESHLYVALWKGYAPDRWGYSLWSGCSEEHEFAWKEIEIPESVKDDMIESVEPLTTSIVETLEHATEENCFLSEC